MTVFMGREDILLSKTLKFVKTFPGITDFLTDLRVASLLVLFKIMKENIIVRENKK